MGKKSNQIGRSKDKLSNPNCTIGQIFIRDKVVENVVLIGVVKD